MCLLYVAWFISSSNNFTFFKFLLYKNIIIIKKRYLMITIKNKIFYFVFICSFCSNKLSGCTCVSYLTVWAIFCWLKSIRIKWNLLKVFFFPNLFQSLICLKESVSQPLYCPLFWTSSHWRLIINLKQRKKL